MKTSRRYGLGTSTSWSPVRMIRICRMRLATCSCTKWKSISLCLVGAWNTGRIEWEIRRAQVIAPVTCTSWPWDTKFMKERLDSNYFSSSIREGLVFYISTSEVDVDTIVCLQANHEMRFGPRKTTKPPVDLRSLEQPAQSASKNALTKELDLQISMPREVVSLRYRIMHLPNNAKRITGKPCLQQRRYQDASGSSTAKRQQCYDTWLYHLDWEDHQQSAIASQRQTEEYQRVCNSACPTEITYPKYVSAGCQKKKSMFLLEEENTNMLHLDTQKIAEFAEIFESKICT